MRAPRFSANMWRDKLHVNSMSWKVVCCLLIVCGCCTSATWVPLPVCDDDPDAVCYRLCTGFHSIEFRHTTRESILRMFRITESQATSYCAIVVAGCCCRLPRFWRDVWVTKLLVQCNTLPAILSREYQFILVIMLAAVVHTFFHISGEKRKISKRAHEFAAYPTTTWTPTRCTNTLPP